ncbi:hypothetical protein V5394_004357 [Serratia marcescens]|uniref:hypothetical protein n=1 Tax=Serratia marcescens TaxID=615 RepID=UPI0013DC15A5|nr:hypothetical protein [Serratia marcescens]
MDQVEVALITAGIGSITALLGAFGGAFLANKFADDRWEKQISHDKEKERNRVLRDKGEELHTLIGRWEKLIFLVQMAQVRYVRSMREWDGFNEYIESISLEPGVHDRLESLLHLYFYDLVPLLGKTRMAMKHSNEIFENYRRGLLTDIEESANSINEASITVEENLLQLKESVRERLKVAV